MKEYNKKSLTLRQGSMSTDFVYTLQRSGGGEPATLRVTDTGITFTIPSSITDNELEAIKGIEALAVALKRGVSVTRTNEFYEAGASGA